MRDLGRCRSALSLNTATLGHRRSIEDVVDLCAERGFGAIAPWRRDLATCRPADLVARIRDRGLTVSGLCRSSYFTDSSAANRRAAVDDNARALDLAAELGAACYVLVVGSLPAGQRDLEEARRQVRDGVEALLDRARAVGVPLALEPLHPMTAADRSCLNTLGQALNWCDLIDPNGYGGLGVIVDAYHVWWDPDLAAAVARACRDGRVLGFHVSDWLRDTRDLVTDRGMMGDGVIDLRRLRGWLEGAGYAGPVEVEIFSSANWWMRPAEEVVDVCVERLLTVC
jgi:sugar phosphate isomerase/epimerase